jgi:hypothetical protein
MSEINFVAVIAAAVAAFIATFVWYIVFGAQLAQVTNGANQQTPPWKIAIALIQNLILAAVIAYLIKRTGVTSWLDAAGIGFILWLGLSAMQWVGSMLWENVPLKMALIHGGDWLMKIVLISVIVGVWQ